jgi:hypothetical protein
MIVTTIAWRLDRAVLVRRLSLVYLTWTRTEQTRRLRRLFPAAVIDWRSIDVHLKHLTASPGSGQLDPRSRAQWQRAVESLKRWADNTSIPPADAALVLAAACVLTRWLSGDPTALPGAR